MSPEPGPARPAADSGERVVVTGAFGHVGAEVARALAARGYRVSTLTNRPAPPGQRVVSAVHPLRFDRGCLERAIAGSTVLVNTYWVRLPSHGARFDEAVHCSRLLVEAARAAGVRRFVQVSVSNARPDAPSPYYSGKAEVEELVAHTFDELAVVRPTLVVGERDVLTGNMAWLLRRLPVVPVPRGEHPLQPVTLGDVGALVADLVGATGSRVVEAAGPERYSFRGYLELLADCLGLRRRFVTVPRSLFLAGTGLAGLWLRDTLVSRDELGSLGRGCLVSAEPATCPSSVRAWLVDNAHRLGLAYANDRRARRRSARLARAGPVLRPQ